jgi:hypothetical protein
MTQRYASFLVVTRVVDVSIVTQGILGAPEGRVAQFTRMRV